MFLPDFIQQLTQMGFEVHLEEGYGSRLGFSFDDYHTANPHVHLCSRDEAFSQDYALILRCPHHDDMARVAPHTCLISMLHYATRPQRVAFLHSQQIRAISLDGIVDDHDTRLVQNMQAVAWNGLEAAFDVLEKKFPGLQRPQPWRVLVMGTGLVGRSAVNAAVKLGSIERNNEHMADNGPGSIVTSVGRNLTTHQDQLEALFRQTDILVDATQRHDTSRPAVPNDQIAWLPEHAVIADLSVDPYLLDGDPPVVRGIEGIPQGNLDQYIFEPHDPQWDKTVPESIPSHHRRTTVSCYSWPGIHPESCMHHYAQQLLPLLETLAEINYEALSLGGHYFERAVCRATLREWVKNG